MHTQNWHGDSTDIDKDLYYRCTAFNCNEVFKSYEQQLDHRLNHDELYCRFCCKFCPTRLKTAEHERICPENQDRYVEVVIAEPKEKPKQKGKKATVSKGKGKAAVSKDKPAVFSGK